MALVEILYHNLFSSRMLYAKMFFWKQRCWRITTGHDSFYIWLWTIIVISISTLLVSLFFCILFPFFAQSKWSILGDRCDKRHLHTVNFVIIPEQSFVHQVFFTPLPLTLLSPISFNTRCNPYHSSTVNFCIPFPPSRLPRTLRTCVKKIEEERKYNNKRKQGTSIHLFRKKENEKTQYFHLHLLSSESCIKCDCINWNAFMCMYIYTPVDLWVNTAYSKK